MSSSRKRAFRFKAKEEIENMKQKMMFAEHHYNVMKSMAEILAMKSDQQQMEIYKLKEKYCPEELTENDKEIYKNLLERFKEKENEKI